MLNRRRVTPEQRIHTDRPVLGDSRTLRRGYSRYFVVGHRVTKQQYERARCTDSTVPPFVASENTLLRPLLEALRKHRETL